MTDVVEIANERRDALAAGIDRLAAEIGTLNDFIRMAEKLVKDNRLESNRASATEDEKAAESTVPATVHPYSAAADGNGAESEHEDLPARELKSEEQVSASRAKKNESEPDRKTIFRGAIKPR
jgi:hypothetical protein